MCGIFGGIAKKGKKLNQYKLQMLGLYNESRGTDSCGYYYNGFIGKGIEKYSKFSEYIAAYFLTKGNLTHDIFIGHTRKSTSGSHSFENAHPHKVENYIQTHNGVITNHWTLCNDYKIPHGKIYLDSIALATLIQKEGFKILNEYKGYAALAMTYEDTPDSLFLYHGASKEEKDGKLIEERPLFILEQPEGFYYSSISTALLAISDNIIDEKTESLKYNVEPLKHNVVFEIKNNKITEVFQVKRDDNNIKEKYTQTFTGWNENKNNKNHSYFSNNNDILKLKSGNEDLILNETYPSDAIIASNALYYRHSRYYKCANELLHGIYLVSRDKRIYTERVMGIFMEEFAFYRGVMLNDVSDFEKLETKVQIDINYNFAFAISNYSKYPVFNLSTEASKINNENKYRWWYKNSVVRKTTFLPKFSKNIYVIEKGITKEISNNVKENTSIVKAS